MPVPDVAPDAHRGLQAAVIRFAVRFRGIVVALAFLLLGYGAISLTQAKYDVFPEFAPPQVGIQAEAPGLTAEQVEVLVTQPIENAVNGVPGVESLRSVSIQGLAVITIIFQAHSDIFRDRQVVSERLAEAAQELPANIPPPTITPLTSSSSTVLVLGLTSETRSLMDMRTLADWTLRQRLLAVPGVAKVAVFGSDIRSLQVQIHPDQLLRFSLSMEDVLAAARKATAITGAGFIETANQRIVFQSEGQSIDPADIARTVVTSANGSSVLLKDVADVLNAPEPPIGGATIMGKPGVVLLVSGQLGANTIDVTEGVEKVLANLRPSIEKEGVEMRADLFRPADFIAISTRNVQKSLLLGGILVVVVLFLFLYDLRTATISSVAIPLSLLAAVVVLNALGATLNAMTLGGLAIAIGEVVDDAVIDVENISRRLRENRRSANPLPIGQVIVDASLEVRGSVVYATFAVILVFLPVVMLPGLAGRFFAPLGLAYVLAILASLAVAMIVTPALCMLLFPKNPSAADDRTASDPPVTRWLRGRYETMLTKIVAHPRTTLAAAFLFTLVGCSAVPFFGAGFLPELKEGHFTLHMAAVPGTSITESQRIGVLVTDALLKLPFVRVVSQRIGRAEQADDTWGTHYSEFEVDLQRGLTGAQSEEAQIEMRKVLAGFPGVNFALKPFLTERVEESLSGYTASVIVNIYGNDLNELDATAQEVARELNGIEGATEVQLQSPPGLPQLTIRPRKADLERWGLDTVEVLNVLRTAYQGDIVGQTYEGSRVFNVIAILDKESRENVANVANLPLRTRAGNFVLLKQIADVFQTAGRYQVDHLGGQRLQAVTANVIGRDVSSFVAEAEETLNKKLQLPSGVHLEFAGSAQAQAQAQRDLIMNSLVAGLGILILLILVTGSLRNVLLVLANMPFAMVGGVLAVFATGGVLTLGSMVGFVTLFGITLRNSIMMISHYEHIVGVEGVRWGPEAAIAGAGDRLAPILMTSIVTALGLLPLAVGMNEPGREIEGPMALVIVGGLATSMALNLLVLPTLALQFGKFGNAGDPDRAATAEPAKSPGVASP
jgi:CzcA family heavy metal efflux pump